MNKELLIVEDEQEICEILRDALSSQFSKVHEAKNGQEGLEIIKNNKLSLIITDFNMPKLDGAEFIKVIRSQQKNIPIIMLTGRGSDQIRRQVWAYGIWEYFEKPFNVDEMITCVERVLSLPDTVGFMYNHVNLLNFAEITVMLEKRKFAPFVEHCLGMGLSPASVTKDLILKYIQENHLSHTDKVS